MRWTSVGIRQSETLKYLFLLYSEDDVLPLDQYVFNTEVGAISTVCMCLGGLS